MKYLKQLHSQFLPVAILSTTISLVGCGDGGVSVSPLPETPSTTPDTSTPADTTAPVITLTGEDSITIFQNTSYVDAGATATDAVDGSVDVTTIGTVNETSTGDYTLTYTATDAAGNEASVTRTITVSPAVLSGTAAGGAAIVGTVVVKGALGNAKSSVIEADGNYEVDVTGLTAPYRLRAEGTVGGKSYKLHSYTEEASVGGTVNITPFTDLIIANTAQQLAENFFDSTSDTSLDADELAAQEDALQAKLQNVFDALGLDTAIDLLNSSFSADHSGVDAALDLISIETDDNNIATITNLLDDSSITDDITDTDDNDAEIFIDADGVTEAVTDTVAIANLFESFTSNFSDGLPKSEDIEDLFGDDFLTEDESLAEFFSDILTDPGMIGVSFISLSVNDLDSDEGTALVSFSVAFGDFIDSETEYWYVEKDEELGWLLLGDQQAIDLHDLNYHCNDYDATDDLIGGCGINTSFLDDDFSNNETDGEPILSASVSIISGVDGAIKDTFYIGTPEYSSEGQIYNEGQQQYTGDYRAFGDAAGEIDSSIFSVGDTVEYNFYQANLDLTDPSEPAVVGDSLFSFSQPIGYEAQTVGKYPSVTAETITNLDDFTLGEDITITWVLADGTKIDEVLVQIDDQYGNYILSVWTDLYYSTDTTSLTVDKAMFDEELLENDNFDPDYGYTVVVRIYAADTETGQTHSADYRVNVDASGSGDDDGSGDGDGTTPSTLTCGYESGWDEDANDGSGEPINPNSYTDFMSVIADCGGTTAISESDVSGTTWTDDGETLTYNDDGEATKASPNSGQFVNDEENIDFEWYIEVDGSYTYLTIETDSSIDSDLDDGFWFRETHAITQTTGTIGSSGATYSITHYAEQSNYSDSDRATGSDGEIWNTTYTVSSTDD